MEVTGVRPEQPRESPRPPILVTDLGIVIEVRPEQTDESRILNTRTEFGIVIEVRP